MTDTTPTPVACPCNPATGTYRLGIEDGTPYLIHDACGLHMDGDWATDALHLAPIPVTVDWHAEVAGDEQIVEEWPVATPSHVAEIAQLRAALALASGGDTARDTVRRLLTKASDNAKRADTAEARVATLEHVAQGNKEHVKWAVKCAQRAQAEQDRLYNSLCAARTDARHLADANAALGRETRLLRVVAVEAIHAADDLVKQARARVNELETVHAAVRALHQPTNGRTGWDPDEDDTPNAYGPIARACTSCGSNDLAVRYPCDTLRALDAAVPARTQEPQP